MVERYCFGNGTPSVIVFAIPAQLPSLHSHLLLVRSGPKRSALPARTMAARAGASAHFTVVNTIAERNHRLRRARRNRKTGIGMCALRRLRIGPDDLAGWRRQTRTRSELRLLGFRARHALIGDPVDSPLHVVGDEERTVRPNRDSRRTMYCLVREPLPAPQNRRQISRTRPMNDRRQAAGILCCNRLADKAHGPMIREKR